MLLPRFSQSLPLWGRWHGEAVTDEVASIQHLDKSEFIALGMNNSEILLQFNETILK